MEGDSKRAELSAAENLRRELSEGLLYAHARLADNAKKATEAESFVYGLIELLVEKGLVSVEELDDRKRTIAERLAKKSRERGMGVVLQEPEYDKDTYPGVVEIDCENRVEFCKAACCKLPFALSKQDIRERIINWDLGQPYLIAQREDGYCSHLQSNGCQCGVWKNRPVPCRAYDCRKDNKIWLDFANKVVNPEILQPGWPRHREEGTGES